MRARAAAVHLWTMPAQAAVNSHPRLRLQTHTCRMEMYCAQSTWSRPVQVTLVDTFSVRIFFSPPRAGWMYG